MRATIKISSGSSTFSYTLGKKRAELNAAQLSYALVRVVFDQASMSEDAEFVVEEFATFKKWVSDLGMEVVKDE